ncbi:chemotaxis protein CheB [Candidatus Enterovibrio escicola]|uniref:chemotaxis protein CheB n=1 Tax=Candidatus Enterovibrio escicola TaxID=1927127 RepID=UPI0013140327|nr:chemotaxis protein CheB [Candidatus Enterovibrio escacola]
MSSKSFAERLNCHSKLRVQELEAVRAPLVNGYVYVALGDYYIRVVRRSGCYSCVCCDRYPVKYYRLSVDVMFSEIAETAGKYATSIVLTGMG